MVSGLGGLGVEGSGGFGGYSVLRFRVLGV